eukprot:455247-Amphidinium_carterae.1
MVLRLHGLTHHLICYRVVCPTKANLLWLNKLLMLACDLSSKRRLRRRQTLHRQVGSINLVVASLSWLSMGRPPGERKQRSCACATTRLRRRLLFGYATGYDSLWGSEGGSCLAGYDSLWSSPPLG